MVHGSLVPDSDDEPDSKALFAELARVQQSLQRSVSELTCGTNVASSGSIALPSSIESLLAGMVEGSHTRTTSISVSCLSLACQGPVRRSCHAFSTPV